jgi:hypothetical protein
LARLAHTDRHGEGSEVVLGKVAEGGAHPRRMSTVRWRFTVWRRRFVDGKPARWLKAEVEGSCSTRKFRGGVRHGKSDETQARSGAHRRRPQRRCFDQNLARRRPTEDRALTRREVEGVGVLHGE